MNSISPSPGAWGTVLVFPHERVSAATDLTASRVAEWRKGNNRTGTNATFVWNTSNRDHTVRWPSTACCGRRALLPQVQQTGSVSKLLDARTGKAATISNQAARPAWPNGVFASPCWRRKDPPDYFPGARRPLPPRPSKSGPTLSECGEEKPRLDDGFSTRRPAAPRTASTLPCRGYKYLYANRPGP
jgi:hypothetical protein